MTIQCVTMQPMERKLQNEPNIFSLDNRSYNLGRLHCDRIFNQKGVIEMAKQKIRKKKGKGTGGDY